MSDETIEQADKLNQDEAIQGYIELANKFLDTNDYTKSLETFKLENTQEQRAMNAACFIAGVQYAERVIDKYLLDHKINVEELVSKGEVKSDSNE